MTSKTLLTRTAGAAAACAAAMLATACAGTSTPTTAEREQLTSARAWLATDPNRAAAAAEALLEGNPSLREARLLLAECSLQLAEARGASMVQFHRIDAANYFDRALDGADDATFAAELLRCAENDYQLERYQDGSHAARRSARGFAARPGLDNQRNYAAARLVGANCDLRLFVAERQAEIDAGSANKNGVVPPTARTVALAQVAANGYGEARRHFPAEATCQLATIQMFLGQPLEVMREYERGLQQAPTATAIHDAYVDWMCRSGFHEELVGCYRRLMREHPDQPRFVYQAGIAQFARADQLRRESNFAGAVATYAEARKSFDTYRTLAPQHREHTDDWRALCDLSGARCAADGGDTDSARELLLRAAHTSANITAYHDGKPRMVDTFSNHFTATAFAIHIALSQLPDDALAQTLAFNEAVLQQAPDRWGFVYNNAALAARDLGVQRHRDGDTASAEELWQRSYGYYEKAIELSPDDAGIANDCGLMLLYHLDRDFDRARALFDRAIELGTAQLAALADDADKRDRENLEMAVGDAWQNIAVMMRDKQQAPFTEYRQFCEQSVRYFPYQRREAAMMLREADQGDAAEALEKIKPRVDELAEAGNFDGALTELDKLSKQCKEFAPYHLLRGKMNWRLGNQARDNNRKGVEFFYLDAVSALQRAVELDAEKVEPRQLLAQAQYDANRPNEAADTASTLLLHLQSIGGGTAAQNQAAHTLRANAAARAYATAKSGGEDDPELLLAARTSMRWLEQKQALDANLIKLWATTEQWAGAPAEAVNVYVRASERNPNDFGLLEQLINLAAEQNQLPLAVESLSRRDDAGTVWYLGKAQFYLASSQRQSGKPDEAIATLQKARQSFGASMQKNNDYRDSCEQWIAMCVGKQGNIRVQQEKWQEAEELLLSAARLRPDRIEEDLGLAETTKRGILRLVDHYYRGRDLAKVESISRAAADAANSDVDLLNNAGLFARDYGNILERDGKAEAAREMYEQSYKAYRRAQQLDPSNVRLRNDCALIAIYHLERDWELSKQLLDAATADGERTLRESPPENEELRQQLEEAVGDCYENLALWHIKHSKDYQAAIDAAKQSQQFHPGARRPGALRHLRTAEQLLQGK